MIHSSLLEQDRQPPPNEKQNQRNAAIKKKCFQVPANCAVFSEGRSRTHAHKKSRRTCWKLRMARQRYVRVCGHKEFSLHDAQRKKKTITVSYVRVDVNGCVYAPDENADVLCCRNSAKLPLPRCAHFPFSLFFFYLLCVVRVGSS